MKRGMTWLAFSVLGFATIAEAQDKKLEIGGNVGYTLSDGVSGDPIRAGDGNIYDNIGPKDSISFGLSLGYFVTPTTQLEFVWNHQGTQLEVSGTNTVEIGDVSLDDFHGGVSYHFGDTDASARPYLSLGLGATSTGGLDFIDRTGATRSIDGSTRFSGRLGAGVKIYPSDSVGLRLGASWVPTYIKSDAEGYWCDPYWGCYVVGDAQYANQFELSAGLSLRF
jgi:outer membrane protein W